MNPIPIDTTRLEQYIGKKIAHDLWPKYAYLVVSHFTNGNPFINGNPYQERATVWGELHRRVGHAGKVDKNQSFSISDTWHLYEAQPEIFERLQYL